MTEYYYVPCYDDVGPVITDDEPSAEQFRAWREKASKRYKKISKGLASRSLRREREILRSSEMASILEARLANSSSETDTLFFDY